MEVGVICVVCGLEWLFSVIIGGSGGSNVVDNLFVVYEGKVFVMFSDGYLLFKIDLIFRKKKNYFSFGCLINVIW